MKKITGLKPIEEEAVVEEPLKELKEAIKKQTQKIREIEEEKKKQTQKIKEKEEKIKEQSENRSTSL